ncbi:MAG: aminotransferase class III-fold pyridoxal phosphate-dependent enzyme [Polyangiaceae bacterium]
MEDYSDLLRHGFDEYRDFINPLIAERAALAGEPLKVIRTEEGRIATAKSSWIEDLHGTQAFGHKPAPIIQAMREYLESDAPSWYPARVNPFAGRLARRLAERTGYDNAFFGCTGSDAVEAALKLSRALTRRPKLLALTGGYHGCSYGSVSLMSPGYLRDPFAPFVEGAAHLEFGDVDALRHALRAEDVACIVVEPIQGEGGVRELPRGYIEALCELTERHGTLLVADEVQTGLGRAGQGFLASERWPRRPDIALLAKHLGGGLMPISAMLTRRELFEQAYGAHFASGESHNTTMGFNALSAVAALSALELLTPELMQRVVDLGARFKSELYAALRSSPLVREVRGSGFMLGVSLDSLDHPWLSFEHFGFTDLKQKSVMAPLVCHRMYPHGYFAFSCGHDWSILRMQPRFNIPEERLFALPGVLREAIDYLESLG